MGRWLCEDDAVAQSRCGETGFTWALQTAISPPALLPDEVHVWTIDLDASGWPVADLAATLSTEERRLVTARSSELEGRRTIVARGMRRELLAAYLGLDSTAIRFRVGARGKPALREDTASPPLQFSATRSQGLAMIAVGRCGPIGVDVETFRTIQHAGAIAALHFTPAERSLLASCGTDKWYRVFLGIWTVKEAWLKAVGDGIAHDGLLRVEVVLDPDGLPILHSIDDDTGAAATWSIHDVPCGNSGVATVAVENLSARLLYMPAPAPLTR